MSEYNGISDFLLSIIAQCRPKVVARIARFTSSMNSYVFWTNYIHRDEDSQIRFHELLLSCAEYNDWVLWDYLWWTPFKPKGGGELLIKERRSLYASFLIASDCGHLEVAWRMFEIAPMWMQMRSKELYLGYLVAFHDMSFMTPTNSHIRDNIERVLSLRRAARLNNYEGFLILAQRIIERRHKNIWVHILSLISLASTASSSASFIARVRHRYKLDVKLLLSQLLKCEKYELVRELARRYVYPRHDPMRRVGPPSRTDTRAEITRQCMELSPDNVDYILGRALLEGRNHLLKLLVENLPPGFKRLIEQ